MSEDHLDAEEITFPDPAARLRKHVQDRLHVLEKNGQCPVCNTTQWALLNSSDVAPHRTATQFSGWPTYALACGNCGFVRHHLKTIFDGAATLGYAAHEDGSRVAGGDVGAHNGNLLEAKVAVLEKIAAMTEDLLAELRWDMKAVRSKQEEDYRSFAERMASHSEKLSEKVSGSTLKLYGAVGLAAACVLGVVAKGFRWF